MRAFLVFAWAFLFACPIFSSVAAEEIFTRPPIDFFPLYPLLFLTGVACLFVIKPLKKRSKPEKRGFISIHPHFPCRFVPFDPDGSGSFEEVVKSLASRSIKIFSDLSKMEVVRKGNRLAIEDKNIKISFLLNRRRNRSHVLKDGDIIDIGDLMMLFVDPESNEKNLAEEKAKRKQKNNFASGKMLRGTAALYPLDKRHKTFFFTKNVAFVGRSDDNDLVIKVMDVSLKHSKIQRIADHHVISDLASENGTFVNGRRINEKYLADKDLVAFQSVQYRFSATGKPL